MRNSSTPGVDAWSAWRCKDGAAALVLASLVATAITLPGCTRPAVPIKESGLTNTGSQRNITSAAATQLSEDGATEPLRDPAVDRALDLRTRPADSVTSESSEASAPNAPLNGEYNVIFHSSSFGSLSAKMTAQSLRTQTQAPLRAGAFKANTRPGIAWSLVGGVAESVGPLLAPFIFPSGMLLVWESDMPVTDPQTGTVTPGRGWIGVSRIGQFRARTVMKAVDQPIEVVFKDGRVIAAMTLAKANTDSAESTDYAALTRAAIRETRTRLYSPTVAASTSMNEFCETMQNAAADVQDDVEYAFAGALAWRAHKGLPLALAYRAPDAASRAVMATTSKPVKLRSLTHDEKSGIVTIEVLAFDDAADFESLMSEALDKNPAGVILDLRSCTGFDLSALHAVGWFVQSPTSVGAFIPGPRREEFSGKPAPAPTENIILQSTSDVAVAHERIKAGAVVSLTTAPAQRNYTGPLAILTLERTRGTAEAAAHILKSRSKTHIVGEATANRPRLSFERPLEQGYVIRIPEYDWLPPGGELGNARVRPDTKASKDAAPKVAAEWILNRS
jgi:hypothetical protein